MLSEERIESLQSALKTKKASFWRMLLMEAACTLIADSDGGGAAALSVPPSITSEMPLLFGSGFSCADSKLTEIASAQQDSWYRELFAFPPSHPNVIYHGQVLRLPWLEDSPE